MVTLDDIIAHGIALEMLAGSYICSRRLLLLVFGNNVIFSGIFTVKITFVHFHLFSRIITYSNAKIPPNATELTVTSCVN